MGESPGFGREGEELNIKMVKPVNKHFVLNDQWEKAVLLTIFEAWNRNLEGLCLSFS